MKGYIEYFIFIDGVYLVHRNNGIVFEYLFQWNMYTENRLQQKWEIRTRYRLINGKYWIQKSASRYLISTSRNSWNLDSFISLTTPLLIQYWEYNLWFLHMCRQRGKYVETAFAFVKTDATIANPYLNPTVQIALPTTCRFWHSNIEPCLTPENLHQIFSFWSHLKANCM